MFYNNHRHSRGSCSLTIIIHHPALPTQVANIVAMNASLVLISLSLNQIIRSGIPIITAILGIAIEKKVGWLLRAFFAKCIS